MKFLSAIFAMSDEQAMWRVQMHDDSQAFAQLVARWEEPIKRLCIRMLGDEHKADDMTQEAFARIYSKRKDFQHGSKFSTFLWRIATNLCLDELRRIKRRREFSVLPQTHDSGETDIFDDLPSREQTPDSAAQQDENAALVRHAVMQLPEHYRSVVVLRHYEDLKFREIAEVLSIPEGTVKSRMSEALSLLNHALQKTLQPTDKTEPRRSNPDRRELLVL
jgi:RNA polymerase sigma-70 factor (ECF subfamily)